MLSPLVVNHTLPLAYQAPSPPLKEVPLAVVVQVTVLPVTTASSRTPAERSPQVVGRKRRSLPVEVSSVRYTFWPTGSHAAASWLNTPMAGRTTPGPSPAGSHSHTRPVLVSSHDSQVAQGVAPPAQFRLVPDRIRYASTTSPLASNRTAPTPPDASSLLDTYTHPSAGVGKHAPPSGAPCHT